MSSETLAAPFATGGPVCHGDVAGFVDPAAADLAAGVILAEAAAPVPCPGADLTTLAGPVAPMAFPGPLPAGAPIVPAAPPVPVIPPIPPVPGGIPPVPLTAPGPAGAAAASPLAGVLTDAYGYPVDLAGGSK